VGVVGQAVIALALVAVTFDACGSSSKPAVSAAGTPLQQSCAAVAAVLANGPDESEDPVGYAEAQILPLRAVLIQGDATLEQSVVGLSNAYKQFNATGGSAAAQSAVKAAATKVDAVCPGATS
jgi:hypothetical protein